MQYQTEDSRHSRVPTALVALMLLALTALFILAGPA